jgi:type III secretory pathway component EscS
MIHFLAMVMMAAMVGVVFGIVGRDTQRERLLYGLKVFGEFVGIGLGLAWLLYFLPF